MAPIGVDVDAPPAKAFACTIDPSRFSEWSGPTPSSSTSRASPRAAC